MTTVQRSATVAHRSGYGTLYDVLDLILDKGIVIDVFARVSLVGIELITVDIRIVVASVDTYLRFAEATNRLDLEQTPRAKSLPDLLGDMGRQGAEGKTKGAVSGAAEAVSETFKQGRSEEKETSRKESRPRRKRSSSSGSEEE